MKLTPKQQKVKLTKALETVSKEVLNEFVPAFYRASFMIPRVNLSFAWLLENGIVRDDGFVLFDKEVIEECIANETFMRNRCVVEVIKVKYDTSLKTVRS